jgi:hypothetical protein
MPLTPEMIQQLYEALAQYSEFNLDEINNERSATDSTDDDDDEETAWQIYTLDQYEEVVQRIIDEVNNMGLPTNVNGSLVQTFMSQVCSKES